MLQCEDRGDPVGTGFSGDPGEVRFRGGKLRGRSVECGS